jgi:hypothetical protein
MVDSQSENDASDPREVLRKRAHEHARRHGVAFSEALAAVANADRELSQAAGAYYR